ncbi:MAG: hypothetical protein LBK06_05375, partial [Planctomycetaceae bacterium]|nr:hypothetical protein [Planctomycetaceae bacterium]
MRFDLTYAAFRVLDRASRERLPLYNSTEITAAKLLIALFNEEDCRAVQWLHEAGLSLTQFRHEFDLDTLEKIAAQPTLLTDDDNNDNDNGNDNEIVQLQMPISAPAFQAGSYGVPVEAYSAGAVLHPNNVNTVAATNSTNSISNVAVPTDPDGNNAGNQYPAKQHKKQEQDELILNENNTTPQTSKRYYSLFAANPENHTTNTPANQTPNKYNHWFYVDDQPVTITQLSPELEIALETVGQQCRNLNIKSQKIPTENGGVRTIETTNNQYSTYQPIATEHLLLAIAMDTSDVGCWLSDHGLDSSMLQERIVTLNTHNTHQNTYHDQFDQQVNTGCQVEKSHLPAMSTDDNFESDHLCSSRFKIRKAEYGSATTWSDCSRAKPTAHTGSGISYKIYRLLDAAANRGREATRVLEDYARFVIDDPILTQKLKDFRHKLQTTLTPIDTAKRLAAREAENDVGKEIEAENEYSRNS